MKRVAISLLIAVAVFFAGRAVLDTTTTADEGVPGLKLKLKDTSSSFWIYDDLEGATAKAKASGKPILVNIR